MCYRDITHTCHIFHWISQPSSAVPEIAAIQLVAEHTYPDPPSQKPWALYVRRFTCALRWPCTRLSWPQVQKKSGLQRLHQEPSTLKKHLVGCSCQHFGAEVDDVNATSRSAGLEPIFQAGLLRLRPQPTVDTPAGVHPPGCNTCRPLGEPHRHSWRISAPNQRDAQGTGPSGTSHTVRRGCQCPWSLSHLLNAHGSMGTSVAIDGLPGIKWSWPLKSLWCGARAMLKVEIKMKREEDGNRVSKDQKTQSGLQSLCPHPTQPNSYSTQVGRGFCVLLAPEWPGPQSPAGTSISLSSLTPTQEVAVYLTLFYSLSSFSHNRSCVLNLSSHLWSRKP